MLSPSAFAEFVTKEVRAHLPDVSAARTLTSVTWRRGRAIATLDATERTTWLLRAGARTHTERFNANAARPCNRRT
jgi:hypothetical protein